MNTPSQVEIEVEKRKASRLLDVLIRYGLIVAMVVLCYRIFAPFLSLMIWAIILAVTLYPMHLALARKMGGKQWLAATAIVILGSLLIITPTVLLVNSMGDSVQELVTSVQNDTLVVPPPREGVEGWPVIGKKLHAVWSTAHTDLPGFMKEMKPKIGDLSKKAVSIVAGLGVEILLFIASFIIAGILMAFGEAGDRGCRAILNRILGNAKGEQFEKLATATIRAVAQGVIGVAFIQAILIGVVLLIAGVPLAGVLAVITLLLGILQVPAMIITLPAIGYIWSSGDYTTGAATTHTIILLIAGMADNVLKPLMLGRGVDVPMPVVLFGALGGMASAGILGMFVGAVLLTLGYQIFMIWVDTNPDVTPVSVSAAQHDAKPVT